MRLRGGNNGLMAAMRRRGGKVGVSQTRSEAGFTIIGLLLAIAIINIGMAVAVTSLVTVDRRAKEAELIWRGQQYARALQCHQSQEGGLPTQLDELLESDCIRALYPEPMSRDGQWRIIRQGELEEAGFGGGFGADDIFDSINRELSGPEAYFDRDGGAAGRGRGASPSRSGSLGMSGSRGQSGTLGQSGSLQQAMDRFRLLRSVLERRGSGARIVGVASRSTKEALRLYNGETTYDAWLFVAEGPGG